MRTSILLSLRSSSLVGICTPRERQVSLQHLMCTHPGTMLTFLHNCLSEIIRLGCDLMNLFYVYDEYTDVADGDGADKIRDIVMDAFQHPEHLRPEGECPVGAMARE